MNTLLIIMICAVYVLSTFGAYKFIQLSHYHPRSKYKIVKPDRDDVFLTFIPLVNTYFCLFSWLFDSPYEKHIQREQTMFKPRKKL